MLAYFDSDFYLNQNPDVRENGADPLDHYLLFGWSEGRDPSGMFSERGYRRRYGLRPADGPALAHFESNLSDLALSPHPLIDREHVFRQVGFEVNALMSRDELLTLPVDLSLHPVFDLDWMLYTYPDLGGTGVNPCVHYLFWGEAELRDPRAEVSAGALRDQLDALGAGPDELSRPVSTWLTFGSVLALRPNWLQDPEADAVTALEHGAEANNQSVDWSGSSPLIDWRAVDRTSRPSVSSGSRLASVIAGPEEYAVSIHSWLPRHLVLAMVNHYHRG